MIALTPSFIVARALGLKPDGVPSKHAGHCAYCGACINPGELYAPFSARASFMDSSSLAARGSSIACGDCAVLIQRQGLRDSAYGMFHSNGVTPFRKWKDVRASLLEPPSGAFVAVYATANNQHMAWRAPVNYSRDRYYVRVGLRDLLIRRLMLVKAIQAVERMGLQVGRTHTRLKSGDLKSYPSPFINVDPELKSPATGCLVPKTKLACAQADIDLIESLTTGEVWAMPFLISPGAGTDVVRKSD